MGWIKCSECGIEEEVHVREDITFKSVPVFGWCCAACYPKVKEKLRKHILDLTKLLEEMDRNDNSRTV